MLLTRLVGIDANLHQLRKHSSYAPTDMGKKKNDDEESGMGDEEKEEDMHGDAGVRRDE